VKIEKRGKYPGVKVHLDRDEVRVFLGQMGGYPDLVAKLRREIEKELKEHPDLLEERTPEQIKEELQLELRKAQEKLAKMEQGKQWNGESSADPVHYLETKHVNELGDKQNPGWYFWTETWADSIGPFDSELQAREQLEIYLNELGPKKKKKQ
jgi:hypothetical protein